MTRPKAVIVVAAVALVFAGLASWMVYDYLQKAAAKTKAVQGQGIVVAAVDIPLGGTLNATQVKSAGWPKESMPPGSITDPNAVVGRVAVRSISAGEPITEAKLMPREGAQSAGIMSYIIPTGHRAVTVAVNEVAGVAGFLTPRNKVDVVVTTTPTGSGETISKIVLQNVPILATGQLTEQKEGKPVVVPTVTLDLTPKDSEKLVLAASRGTLEMLLRNIADNTLVETRGATIGRVLSGVERPIARAAMRKAPVRKAKTVQVKQPPPQPSRTLEIINGNKRSVYHFFSEK
jgi:pilus assembly protein CpaB